MLKKFLPYLGEYKKYAVLTPLLMVLEVLCELALPRFMANIVDVGIPGNDLSYILKMGGIMLVLAVGSMLCGMFGSRLAAVADFDRVLSLSLIEKAEELRKKNAGPEEEHDERIEGLLAERAAAKKAKDFAEADRLRDEVLKMGYVIEDTPKGPKVKKA